MNYLIISLLYSVSVGVFFKIIKSKTEINIVLIALNYFIAMIFSYTLFNPKISYNEILSIPYHLVIPIAILLPSVFLILPKSIQNSGIIKTDIAQRLSLIIPILSSYYIFGEKLSFYKILALLLGFLSIFFILNKSKGNQFISKKSYYLLIVFLGYGIVDVLFKKLALYKEISYTSTLFYIFFLSFLISLFILFYNKLKHINAKTIFYGLLLGGLNFSNIYFYLKAHQYFKESPITVFATMNFGVILLGTIIGSMFFKEKLSKINIVGLVLSLLAITIIILSQYYA